MTESRLPSPSAPATVRALRAPSSAVWSLAVLCLGLILSASVSRAEEPPAAPPSLSPVFPGKTWERRAPAEVGLDESGLREFARLAGGRGCIVRKGYLVHSWGDITRSADIASASKPLYSHLLFVALKEEKVESVNTKVSRWIPCLEGLNPALGHKDRALTLRHLAFQTACLGYEEAPGTAFDYNDHTMGLFFDVVVNHLHGVSWTEARKRLFAPALTEALGFEDPFTFPESGRQAGRPRVSPRDFARFGLLYLHRGRWREKELIRRADAVRAVSEPLPLSIPRTAGKEAERCATRSIGGGGNQCDHNGGYSWLWWVNGVARDGERWWRSAPEDLFCALGHCGQRGVAVLPSLELIVSWNDAHELHCDRELGDRAFAALANAAR